jgi:hypothetical protein
VTRFLNGPVLNLLLVAGIGLPIYYATTLTEREARPGYQHGPSISGSYGRPGLPLRERRDADGAGGCPPCAGTG